MDEQNNTKLVIKIDYNEPIEIIDLTIALNALSRLYQGLNNEDKEAKLFIKEIRKSSIEIDFITNCWNSVVPLISSANSIVQFCAYLKVLLKTCLGIDEGEVQDLTERYALPTPNHKSIKQFGEFSNVIKNSRDVCNISAQEMTGNIIFAQCTFTGIEAEDIKQSIQKISNNEVSYTRRKQLFRWVQANFDKESGNRGVISNISKEPIRVIFDKQKDKMQMTASIDEVEWQKKLYVVDVEILFDENRPKVYKILENYEEECFI